jgi:hypothetical protein
MIIPGLSIPVNLPFTPTPVAARVSHHPSSLVPIRRLRLLYWRADAQTLPIHHRSPYPRSFSRVADLLGPGHV